MSRKKINFFEFFYPFLRNAFKIAFSGNQNFVSRSSEKRFYPRGGSGAEEAKGGSGVGRVPSRPVYPDRRGRAGHTWD